MDADSDTVGPEAYPGMRVMYIYPTYGYEGDQKLAREWLTVGSTYTVRAVDGHNWRTDLMLEGVAGARFNSVLFRPAE